MTEKILVTGASGFIATHTILELLSHGYAVRGTVRDLARADAIRTVLSRSSDRANEVEFVQAELTEAAGWARAMSACNGVFHIASPVPIVQPKNANDLIQPARQRTPQRSGGGASGRHRESRHDVFGGRGLGPSRTGITNL